MKNLPATIEDLSITIHDDDESPFDGVVLLLRRCVGYGEESSRAFARAAQRNGSVEIGPWIEPIARCIHEQLVSMAPTLGCGSLRIDLEPRRGEPAQAPPKRQEMKVHQVLRAHFADHAPSDLAIVSREFPAYLRVDVQRALDGATADARRVGVHARNRYDDSDLASMLSERERAKLVGALEFEDVDVGDDKPARLPTNCLSLLLRDGIPLATWVQLKGGHGEPPSLSIEIVAPSGPDPARAVEAVLALVEQAVAEGRTYRGRILSLEARESFDGLAPQALTVHRLAPVAEHELILPVSVREALHRHVVRFAEQRKALIRLGQSGRKGVLLHGPPGTGKTHTVRYLASKLADHTTFIVTAEQVGLIHTYFRLARLFAPSMLVIEDADLVARQRERLGSACEEVLLNRLLNEMDGLRGDSEVVVVMTTNRPDALEAALIQRPGRIDHAIEVPPPDAEGRAALLSLYGSGLSLRSEVVETLVARTEGCSAAFIKELARRLAQASIEASRPGQVESSDLDSILGELLGERSGLNMRLIGGGESVVG